MLNLEGAFGGTDCYLIALFGPPIAFLSFMHGYPFTPLRIVRTLSECANS